MAFCDDDNSAFTYIAMMAVCVLPGLELFMWEHPWGLLVLACIYASYRNMDKNYLGSMVLTLYFSGMVLMVWAPGPWPIVLLRTVILVYPMTFKEWRRTALNVTAIVPIGVCLLWTTFVLQCVPVRLYNWALCRRCRRPAQ
jgi:hypothetical protein